MSETPYQSIQKLCRIIKTKPVNWVAFDQVLSAVEEINWLDENTEETILSEGLQVFFELYDGTDTAEVIRRFLAQGYDVSANEGRNRGIHLGGLCWIT